MKSHHLRIRAPMAFGIAAALAGCTSMSGLDGSASYACKAPDGVTCDSVSGTYANATHNNLPSQRQRSTAAATPDAAASSAAPARGSGLAKAAAPSGATLPLRSSARILRLWFKPWEDADRDLYDQGYVYVQIDSGQWLIDHAQRQIRDAYAPLRPPPKSAASATDAKGVLALPGHRPNAPTPFLIGNPFPGTAPSAAQADGSD